MPMLPWIAFLGMLLALPGVASARWKGPSDPALHAWFDKLASGKGLCCSFADGLALDDPDVDFATVAGADGTTEIRYRVRIGAEWVVVPPAAIVTEPNKFGRPVVWPFQGADGTTQIRCFLPGSGA